MHCIIYQLIIAGNHQSLTISSSIRTAHPFTYYVKGLQNAQGRYRTRRWWVLLALSLECAHHIYECVDMTCVHTLTETHRLVLCTTKVSMCLEQCNAQASRNSSNTMDMPLAYCSKDSTARHYLSYALSTSVFGVGFGKSHIIYNYLGRHMC